MTASTGTHFALRTSATEAREIFKRVRETVEEALPAGSPPTRTVAPQDPQTARWARLVDDKSGRQVHVRKTSSRNSPCLYDARITVVQCRPS